MIQALKSIKGKLSFLFFTFTSLLLITVSLVLYFEVRAVIFDSIDKTLHSKAQLFTGLLHMEDDGEIELEVSKDLTGDYSIPRSGHYYKAFLDGKLLSASPSLANDSFDLASGTLESYDEKLREMIYTSVGPANEPIRVMQYDFAFHGLPVKVFVAESLSNSLSIINRLRYFLFIIVPVSILIEGLIGVWIVKRSLNPLSVFSSRIKAITDKTLNERLDTHGEASELIVLATSFNGVLARLQKAFESEKRMISDASHELRTPVSVIKTHCDVALQKDRTNNEYIETIQTIKTISEDMGRLISDLLALARLDSGILSAADFKPVSLKECLQRTVQMTLPLAQKKAITIKTSFDGDINIPGDKDRLIEAFLNITENAVNYNRENGVVEISAGEKDSKAKILISDTGSGIKANDLERIFERFYRSDTSRNTEGTGLGLSITRAIIEMHGGTIEIESESGKGSCFTITLPVAA